jgi:mannose-6-phosphate isomerase-like protein (cupin superfamily)
VTYKIEKHVKSSWVSKGPPAKEKRPWGHEKTWNGFSGIHGKLLYIIKDHQTSLKYHKLKNEVLFLISGEAEVVFGNELSLTDDIGHPFQVARMLPGSTLLVQSGCPYRIKAIEDCEIIEIGNNRQDPPQRIEDDYGRV